MADPSHNPSTEVYPVELAMTRPTSATEVDAHVRELLSRGEVDDAASLLLGQHGADVFGILVGVLADVPRARAAYAGVVRRVSAELPSFQWRCSSIVWLYSLARRELGERRAHPEPDEPRRVVDTEIWRHAGLRMVIGAVHSTLTEEERELLILRVDRVLDWYSLAITQLGEKAVFAAIIHEARRLRERIETLRKRIEKLTTNYLRLR